MGEPYVMRLRGWRKWSSILCGIAFTLFSVALASGGWIVGGDGASGSIIVGICGVALFAPLLLYCIILARKYKVVFLDDAIEVTTVFRRARMNKADAKGWTDGYNDGSWAGVVLLHSKHDSVPPLEVPLASVKERAAVSWFQDVPNLDQVTAAKSARELLADARYGATEGDRSRALVREHRIGRALLWIAIGATLWIFAWPRPYEIALTVGFALPAVGLILAFGLKDRWSPAFLTPSDQRPALGSLYLFTPWALLVRVFDYDILDQTPLLQWSGLFVLCIVAACLFVRIWPSDRIEQTAIVVLASVYAYAAAAHANVLLDRSDPRLYSAQVLEAVSDSDHILKLSPWGPHVEPREVRVWRGLYEETPAGSKVEIRLYKGRLGARWFTVHGPRRSLHSRSHLSSSG